MYTVLSALGALFSTGILYLGPGFFLSRFVVSKWRNVPTIWIFLSIVFTPVVVSMLSAVGMASWQLVFALSFILAVGGFWISKILKQKKLGLEIELGNKSCSKTELFTYTGIILLFVIALLLPKRGLLLSDSQAIPDDFDRVKMVVSVAYDFNDPRVADNPWESDIYHHFDYVLPALVFRSSALTANKALYFHNALTYVSVFTILLILCLHLFTTIAARIFFLLGATFLGGGIDTLVFRLLYGPYTPTPDPTKIANSVEWWSDHIKHLNAGAHFQISAPYTLLLWAPHHFVAALLVLLVGVLSFEKHKAVRWFLMPILLGASIGFSVFVFMSGVAIAALLLLLDIYFSVRKKKKPITILLDAGVQIAVFSSVILAQFLRYLGIGTHKTEYAASALVQEQPPKLLFYVLNPEQFLLSESVANAVQNALNMISTALFVSFIDLGIIAILAVAYFFVPKDSAFAKQRKKWTAIFAVMILVPWAIALSYASQNSNDLFMRGLVPFCLAALFCASMFVDFVAASTRKTYVILALMAVLQVPTFFIEFFGRLPLSELHSSWETMDYARSQLPKDAVVLTDTDMCNRYISGKIPYHTNFIFRANRVCQHYTNLDEALEIDFGHPVYVWTSAILQNEQLKLQKYDQWGNFIYRKI